MMRERIKRLALIILTTVLVAGIGKLVINHFQKNPQALVSPLAPVSQKIEDLGEKVLGEMVKKLPNAPDLEKVVVSTENEPIEEPVKKVENQTDQLIESLKQLPQDQLEAIKKQIFKEFCETILKN